MRLSKLRSSKLRFSFLLTASLALGGCFNVDEPSCSYSCGPNGECPDDYQCASDNYCHLHGTGVCFYSDASVLPDLSVASQGDMTIIPDEPDLGADFSMPGDLMPPPADLSTPPADLAPSPTPTPTPTPSPRPAIASFGVIDQETTPVASPIPIVITPTSPSPAPANVSVVVTEQVVPSGSASSVTLTYFYAGIGPIPVPMSLASSNGGADQYTCTIAGWPTTDVIVYTVAIDDFFSHTFTDPSPNPTAQSYTYVEQ